MRKQILSFGALLCGLSIMGCEPEVDPNDDPCARVRCKDGTHCEATSEGAQCVPNATCDLECDAGSHCELVEVQCITEPCLPVEECVLDEVGGTPCGAVTCAEGLVCCNASCGICTPPDGACIQVACEPEPDPSLTCAAVLCIEGTNCVETPEGPKCVPNEENPCNLVDCMPNTTCQVIDGEAVCVANENPCNLVDCKPNTTCEVINGEAVCVAIDVEPASCAVTLCPVNTYCDDISGSAVCIPLPSCNGVKCEGGQHCELQEVQCIRSPCPPQPTCVDPDDSCRNPCETARCGKGTHCEAVDVTCVRAPCCPVAQCVANESEPCGKNTCGEGTYCCNESCGICVPKGAFCTQQFCEDAP